MLIPALGSEGSFAESFRERESNLSHAGTCMRARTHTHTQARALPPTVGQGGGVVVDHPHIRNCLYLLLVT